MAADAFEIEPIGGIDEVRAEWQALARRLGNVFATVEWCEAWLAHIGPTLPFRLRLFGCRRADGTLAAILPLVLVTGRYVRKARFLGFGPANELGPIAAPADADVAVSALRATLSATRREWDLFLGENLPGSGWAARFAATVLRREENPTVRGSWDSWDEYLASRSSKFRKQLRRDERRLAEQGLNYRSVSARSDLAGALDVLFELHRTRWGEEASVWFAGQEAFHRDFAHRALEHGWLRLRLLELDGKPVAAYYGLRFGDAELSYQYGRDPSSKKTSVGLVLIARSVRAAFAEGAKAFEFGPGSQAYKRRFATDDSGLETVGLAHGLRGRAALLAARRRR